MDSKASLISAAAKKRLPPPLTEGMRRFQEATKDETLKTMSGKLIASKNAINDWLHGNKRPTRSMRARVRVIYGIPEDCWLRVPFTDDPQPTDSGPPQRPILDKSQTPSTLDDCLDMLAALREQRRRADLISSDRVKLADTEAKVLALRAKLELQAELQEDRLVRTHPAWLKMKRDLLIALKPYPDALEAVIDVLSANDNDDSESETLTNGNGRHSNGHDAGAESLQGTSHI